MKKTYLIAAIAMVLFLVQPAGAYNYGEALQKSIYFYMQQRTGDLPANNPVIWRANSCLNDGADVGLDLTGGYLDAGDNVKFGLPMASTVATLSWGVYEYRSAFTSAGQLDKVLDTIRWGTDYFIKCHTGTNEFYYQVGGTSDDHAWWGPVEVIEEVMVRPSFKVTAASPGSTVVGATAAALASASIVFKPTDPAYASTCLTHAKQLFDFAYSTKSDAGYVTGGPYGTSGFWDELSAAAAWLYLATGDTSYLDKAELCANNWGKEGRRGTVWSYKWTHCWDDMHYMAQILLARVTGKQIYIDSINRNFAYWIPAYKSTYGSSIPGYDGTSITYTPGGLAFLDKWGSLRYATQTGFDAYVWSDFVTDTTKKTILRTFADSQANYALGSNPRASSYLIGFGVNPPKNPHHRTGHGPWYNNINDPVNNAHTLFGALVGGPDATDSYADVRTDYVMNEVACDYTGGIVGILAKMYSLYGGTPLANFPQNYFGSPFEIYRDEYFVRARLYNESATSTCILGFMSNRSAWPATVKDKLSYRYFFDLTETYAAGYTVNDITATLNDGVATLSGPFHWAGYVYYVVLDFTGINISPADRDKCQKLSRFTLSAPTDAAWDPTNDWSRQGLVNSPFNYNPTDLTGFTDYIPVYEAGVLLAGLEPGSGQPPPPPVLHVSNITMVTARSGASYLAKATVTIVDAGGTPVSGATVSGTFSGLTSSSVSGVTGADGKVTLSSGTTKVHGSWTFCVDNVTRTGSTYDSAANVETCDSVSY
jgi:hypothetical protein